MNKQIFTLLGLVALFLSAPVTKAASNSISQASPSQISAAIKAAIAANPSKASAILSTALKKIQKSSSKTPAEIQAAIQAAIASSSPHPVASGHSVALLPMNPVPRYQGCTAATRV